ncbi:hypothetical protein [Kribbella sp.]|nr:hypothetical protein [Kribbella sp.]HZX03881.1 hypothetical protein [Kribbella sp.]
MIERAVACTRWRRGPGIIDFTCYLKGEDLKWSMDIYDTNAWL